MVRNIPFLLLLRFPVSLFSFFLPFCFRGLRRLLLLPPPFPLPSISSLLACPLYSNTTSPSPSPYPSYSSSQSRKLTYPAKTQNRSHLPPRPRSSHLPQTRLWQQGSQEDRPVRHPAPDRAEEFRIALPRQCLGDGCGGFLVKETQNRKIRKCSKLMNKPENPGFSFSFVPRRDGI